MNHRHHIRIAARLDIKGDRLVKGINLEGLRNLGSAEIYSKYYHQKGIDELIIIDNVASLYGRENLFNFVKSISNNIFIPITVGGGLRSIEDINQAFLSGADKVFLNTAAIHNSDILNQSAAIFGSSSIVASIEAKECDGKWFAYYNNGRTNSEKNVLDWINEVQDRGVGEIFLTDIDHEGTGKGLSSKLLEAVSPLCHVPLTISGGIGSKQHCLNVANHVNCICLGSILHYGTPDNIKNSAIEMQTHNGFAPVQYRYKNKNLEFFEIPEIKRFLHENEYDMRLSEEG